MGEILPSKVDNSTQTDPFMQISLKDISDSSDEKAKEVLKEVGWFALKAVGISAAVLGGVAIAVPAIGFGAGGVVGGSLAAMYQSSVLGGTIASGSAFATLQSIGAAGLAASTQAGVVAASTAAAGAHTAAKISKKSKQKEKESNSNETDKTDENYGSETYTASDGRLKRDASTQTESENKQ